jgi:hypothetical protein
VINIKPSIVIRIPRTTIVSYWQLSFLLLVCMVLISKSNISSLFVAPIFIVFEADVKAGKPVVFIILDDFAPFYLNSSLLFVLWKFNFLSI